MAGMSGAAFVNEPAHRIGAAARGEGHDETHSFAGPSRLRTALDPRAAIGAAREEASRLRRNMTFPRNVPSFNYVMT
jgi:hypothetical protein